jgi:iron complex outermembrane receptor protein
MNSSSNARYARGLRWAVALAVAAATPGFAQSPPAATSEDNTPQVQEVIITGSRIPVPANITATSPLTVISRDEIQQQGHSDVGDFINQLPQNVINSGQDLGNNSNPLGSAGGISTVDLRGLGPTRTLVLVDGKRLGNGDPNTLNPNPAADIDQIPAAMIERVDVVTGGASATYGSDAMAGVVNFILRRNFQGVEVDGQYGFNQHGNHDTYMQQQESLTGINPPTGGTMNGYRRDVSLILGANTPDNNGNATGYFVYHNQDPTAGAKYDYADCLYRTTLGCGNSANSNRFTIGGNQYAVVGSQWLPWPQAGQVPPPTFNSSAYEYLQRQDTRYQGGFLSHYDINDHVKPYLDFSFMDDRTTEVVAPSGLFETGNPYSANNRYVVNCGNPFLSAQQLGIVQAAGSCGPGTTATDTFSINIGRRNVEGGGRSSFFDHTNYRVVGGAKGEIIDGITYDAYAEYYYTTLYDANGNYLSLAGINNALIVNKDPTTGAIACASGGKCVPYNIFQQGQVTQAMLASLYEPGTSYGTDTEKISHVDFTADLGKWGLTLPTAHEAPGVNVGWELRHESTSYAPDQASLSGDLSGFSGAAPPIAAGYKTSEGFFEGRVPLLQEMPGVEDLDLDAGYRYSNYSTAGTTNTYKFELQYAPTKDVRLRGSFDRAVRAPNLVELFNPQAYGQQSFFGVDPCVPTVAGGQPTASLAQCLRTGMTAAEYNSFDVGLQCNAGQCGQVTGGNTKLRPEVAMTWSVGASFTPQFLPDFNATIDYYHIAISDEITTIPGAALFTGCEATGDPTFCSQIVRNPVTGSLHGATVAGGGYILQTNINAGARLVAGVDLGANYRYSLGSWGMLKTSFTGTFVQHNRVTPYPGSGSYDCAGLFGANCFNGINPKWRHTMRVTWEMPWRTDISAFWRFIGHTSLDNNQSNSLLFGSDNPTHKYEPNFGSIPNYSYIDVTLTGHVTDNVEVRFGVTNVFDKDPPIEPSSYDNGLNANSLLAYDVLGRQMFLAVSAKF